MTEAMAVHEQTPNREPGQARLDTAHLRLPPSFMIIGTQKGGTTSLFRYLDKHHDVTMAFKKEVHFFDFFYDKGTDWYLAHFPLRSEAVQTGEASPTYLFHPAAPKRIHAAFPEVKFIALLRNPVDRAYSHHQMEYFRGKDPLSFEEAIAQEPERIRDSNPDIAGGNWRRYSYVSRGIYVEQLAQWLVFFPQEQFLFLKSEEFFREPGRLFEQVLRFLELPSCPLPRYRPHNSRGYAPMRSETRTQLTRYYKPYNRQLYELLGRDLGWNEE
jgi:Sulfotransferase domain